MEALPIGQRAMVHIARAGNPITVFFSKYLYVANSWALVPAYTVFFIQIFSVACIMWLRFFKVDIRKTPLLAACVVSSIHAIICVAAGYAELSSWLTTPLHLDAHNTPIQSIQLQFSLAYLVADTIYMLFFTPSDYLFFAHHALAGLYLHACLHLGVGSISAIFVFFMGEVTSPLFNIFNVSKELKDHHPVAAKVLSVVSPIFTLSFVLVRSVISPLAIGWFLTVLCFNSPKIPAPWRFFMGSLVGVGLIGSQVWSYKLVAGYLKSRRKAAKKAAEVKAAKAE